MSRNTLPSTAGRLSPKDTPTKRGLSVKLPFLPARNDMKIEINAIKLLYDSAILCSINTSTSMTSTEETDDAMMSIELHLNTWMSINNLISNL